MVERRTRARPLPARLRRGPSMPSGRVQLRLGPVEKPTRVADLNMPEVGPPPTAARGFVQIHGLSSKISARRDLA